MRIFLTFLSVLIVLIFSYDTKAQELPYTSQIFLNPYFYNPAYAGIENRPAIFFGYRKQWTGIQNAPSTVMVNYTMAFNKKVPFGVNIFSDQRGIINTTNLMFTGGYKASFDDEHYLSFAISAGMGFNGLDSKAIADIDDPAIINLQENSIFPEGNFGILYHNERFNLGVSLPKIFLNKPLSSEAFSTGEISPLNRVIANVSYKWEVSEDNFYIEPFVAYYHFNEQPAQYEGIVNFYLKDVMWIGGGYRSDFGTIGALGFQLGDNFKLGYSFDISTQANLSNNLTHEVQIGLIIGKKERKKYSIYQRRTNVVNTLRNQRPTQQHNVQVENDPFLKAEEPKKEEPTLEEQAEKEFENFDYNAYLEEEKAEEVTETPTEDIKEEEKKEEFDYNAFLQDTDTEDQTVEEEDAGDEFDVDSFLEDAASEIQTRDEEGKYIGPTIVTKGTNLLELETGYYVVVGTFESYREAEEYSDKLFIQGYFTKFGYISQTTDYYVYIFYTADDYQECVDTKDRLLTLRGFKEMWVLTVK